MGLVRAGEDIESPKLAIRLSLYDGVENDRPVLVASGKIGVPFAFRNPGRMLQDLFEGLGAQIGQQGRFALKLPPASLLVRRQVTGGTLKFIRSKPEHAVGEITPGLLQTL